MCGIAGIIDHGPPEAANLAIGTMTGLLEHRGPDDRGHALLTTNRHVVALGATRLAIQAPGPGGHQPMVSDRTGAVVVFNGEIYNVDDLREELARRGLRCKGGSDTEVVLAAYDEWGVECVSRLRGMFAFGLWDPRSCELVLARDRLGIKPLYVARDGKSVAFASEVRSLLSSGMVERRISPEALASYLAFGSVQEPSCMFTGVEMVAPGTHTVLRDGVLTTTAYWSLDDAFLKTRTLDRAAARQELRGLLEDAVRLHLISDVPLGVFLSGGVDSSALVGLVSTVARPPTTVSLVFTDHELSEEPRIREVVARYGTEHKQIELSDSDALTEVPGAMSSMDQPTVDGVNTYIVSRLARSAGVTVALSGVGGDELFGGYPSFRTAPILRTAHRLLPGALGTAVGSGLERALSDNDRARKAAAWLRHDDPTVTPYAFHREVLSRAVREAIAPGLPRYGLSEPPKGRRLAPFDAASLQELSRYMRNTLLRDTDVMGMAHGLEIRVPFLDHQVVELVASLRSPLKRRIGANKPLLVDAVGDLLPGGISALPKRGFTLPFDTWLRGSLRTDVEDTLHSDTGSDLDEVLDRKATAELWKAFLRGSTTWSRPWSLYVLKRWANEQLTDAHPSSQRRAVS